MIRVARRCILTGGIAGATLLVSHSAVGGLGQILMGQAQQDTQQLTADTVYESYFATLELDETAQVRLGELIYSNAIARMGGPYRNSVVQDALNRFARPFFQISLNGLFRWEITLIDNESVNAWVLPGGKIGLHKGVLRYVETADELGWVIAHQMGHAEAGHAVDLMRSEAFFTKLPHRLRAEIAASLNNRGGAGLLEPSIAQQLELPLLAMVTADHGPELEKIADQQIIPAFRQTGLDAGAAAEMQTTLQALYGGLDGESCLFRTVQDSRRRGANLRQMKSQISSLANRRWEEGFAVLKAVFPTRAHFRRRTL